MSQYVDLDKLSNALMTIFTDDRENSSKHFINGIKTAIEVAESMVEKDVGEIVHCRDCIFKGKYKCRLSNLWVDNEDYCSRARRASTNVQGNSGET